MCGGEGAYNASRSVVTVGIVLTLIPPHSGLASASNTQTQLMCGFSLNQELRSFSDHISSMAQKGEVHSKVYSILKLYLQKNSIILMSFLLGNTKKFSRMLMLLFSVQ